jgi:hypothetical protein
LTVTGISHLPHPTDSPAAPPALTQAELKALASGTWLSGPEPLQAQQLPQDLYKALRVTVGASSGWLGSQEIPLAVPITGGPEHQAWFPVKAMAAAMGITVDGNRLYAGGRWLQVVPGSTTATDGRGSTAILHQAPRISGQELLAGSDLFFMLGCAVSASDDTYTFVCPDPARAGESR